MSSLMFIQDLHRKKVKAGESFGAGGAVDWFDDVGEMEKVCDLHAGKRAIRVEGGRFRLE